MKLVVGFAAVLSLVPAALPAQAGCSRTPDYAEETREDLAPLFYDSGNENAEFRGTAIQQLSAADTQYVVRDDSVCEAVLSAAVARMRQYNTSWANGQEGNYSAAVIRFGGYYAVALAEESPSLTVQNGMLSGFGTARGWTLILRADTLGHLLSMG